MTVTIAALHKRLGKLIEAGHGRKPVFVDKASFTDNRENDGVSILPLAVVIGPKWIPMADDDGGTKWNTDGTEAGSTVLVLGGQSAEEGGE